MALLGTTLMDEEIHPESEFEKQYSEVSVTEEEFPALKASLYTHADDADISSAESNVKYKLYNDNDELLQVENVPVVKDGTTISKVVEWYKRTTTNTQPSKTESGWYTTPPTFTGSNQYLWNYEEIEDSKGNSITTTSPVLLSTNGKEIESITEEYAITTTTGTPSESDWSTTVPTLTSTNKYLWNREVIKYVNIATSETTTGAIIGVYGDTGETGATGATGEQGGGYLGPLAAEPATANTGDFFLDTTNQTVKYFDGTNWVEDAFDASNMSWRWNAAIQDCIANAGSSGNLVKAANAWVDKLLVNTAFIDALAAKTITLLTNGLIQSEGYNGLSGFRIKANGEAEFNNTCTLRGNIDNTVIKADAPEELEAFSYSGELYQCPVWIATGDWYNVTYQSTTVYAKTGFIKYLDSDKNVISYRCNIYANSFVDGKPYCIIPSSPIIINNVTYYGATLEKDFSGYKYDVDSIYSKLYFCNLPDEDDASDTNQVYVDEDGFLKIKTE